jgi:hypothetical protein
MFIIDSKMVFVNHSTPFHIQAWGSWKFEWMENYMDSILHKVDNVSKVLHQILYLVSYGILCQYG